MRVLKEWVEIFIFIMAGILSIICLGSIEADNYTLCVICLIINLVNLFIICKYGRFE